MIGIVRVLSSSNDAVLTAHGRVLEEEYGITARSRCIPDQPTGVHDEATAAAAVPKIVETARGLTHEGADAILISCAADPGLAEARAALDVPVFGAGSAAAAVALAIAQPVGVLGITDRVPDPVKRMLGERIVAHQRPQGVTTTTDLLTTDGHTKALDAAGNLLNRGARTILFACTGLTTIGLAADVRRRCGCTVVDAVRAAGAVAAAANGS